MPALLLIDDGIMVAPDPSEPEPTPGPPILDRGRIHG
jgi:hypothetical protein